MGEKFETVIIVLLFILIIVGFVVLAYFMVDEEGALSNLPSIDTKVLGISKSITVNNNFEIPEDISYKQDDLIYEDVETKVTESKNPNGNYSIEIPKIEVSTTIRHSNKLQDLADTGWLVLPWSYEYQDSWFRIPPWSPRKPRSESIVICYRRYYGPTDQRSCYNLDKLTKGDIIKFDNSTYYVKSIVITDKDDSTIFTPSITTEYLKIITNSGFEKDPELNTNYLVIIAQKEITASE